jgi:hypothetical protein
MLSSVNESHPRFPGCGVMIALLEDVAESPCSEIGLQMYISVCKFVIDHTRYDQCC